MSGWARPAGSCPCYELLQLVETSRIASGRVRRPLEIHAGCNPQLAPALGEELARGPPAPYDYVDSL